MNNHQNIYPPYAPYVYPPPNEPNPDPNLGPTSWYLSPLAAFSNPYAPPPSYPYLNASSHYDPNIYPPLQPSRFHHIGDDMSSVHDGLANMHVPNYYLEHPPPIATSSLGHQGYDSYGTYCNSPLSDSSDSPFSDESQHGGNFFGSLHHESSPIVPYMGSSSSEGKSSLQFLLHGSLDINIGYAKNLPNKSLLRMTNTLLGHMINTIRGDNQQKDDPIASEPFVTVSISDAIIACTDVKNNENPTWNQPFYVLVAHDATEMVFTVKHHDAIRPQFIGIVSIPIEKIYSGERIDDIFPVLGTNGMPCNQGAILSLSMQYIPIATNGLTDGRGVPNTYFPLRRGGKVTLYQDAHVPDHCLPNFWLENGMQYKHGQCWRDIFDAIDSAKKLIYIVGWSFCHTITLVRDEGEGKMITIGELLKRKSQEGVRVCLLIWDDPLTYSLPHRPINLPKNLKTNDEETRQFFKHSSVNLLLCPRHTGIRQSIIKRQNIKLVFSHHQKAIVVDVEAGNNKRKLIAFVGGLDLCGGRYDNQTHALFRTLDKIHKDDYYNPNFKEADKHGPRVPWHDLHCKIDGPAAYDVLRNFEERWWKAAKRRGHRKMEDALLNLKRIPDIWQDYTPYMSDNDPESWHVQVFRSVDSKSAKIFSKDPTLAREKNLVCGKKVLIDMSIHTAYVNAIRAAQNFIYIENQYFLSSSFSWNSNKDLGANNLVPCEIALKIANKIKANEPFAAYIVIPMWPEGIPTGTLTQEILYWQRKTMEMMYEKIYKALKEAGLEDKYEPQDYLNFFCLGNRESLDRSPPGSSSDSNNAQAKARKNRRFMIYVHSKGMIVDDEYVIIGSANINQRSLDGTRDTEIAMGAYQPQYTWARKHSSPRGQIYGYRMSLWTEHTGTCEEIFNQPQSLECVRRLRTIGELNWQKFVADEVTEMRGHLLTYPLNVDRMGKVTSLPGYETFPDVEGEITGTIKLHIIGDLTT